MKVNHFTLLIFSIYISIASANATLKVASVLGDNMVLQQNSEVKIWGKASANQKVAVKVGWQKGNANTIANDKGDWVVTVKTINAGGPYALNISSGKEKITIQNVMLGEVWLCSGQSNMEMPIGGYADQPINGSLDALLNFNSNVRLFKVARATSSSPQDTCSGIWNVASPQSIAAFSAIGYFYGNILQQSLKVPVGIICSSWGGSRIEAWMKPGIISTFPNAYKQTTTEKIGVNQRASNLYNGMIAPILNCKFKGALWYQGESNIVNYYDYPALMEAMVKSWRADFGGADFPFYYVQIAPHSYSNSKATNAAFLREAQAKAVSLIPNSGMVSTIDFGEEKNIHPAGKLTISKRLALLALSETYGVKGLPYKSPAYKSMSVKDSVAMVSFDNQVNGLTPAFGKNLNGFEIAGKDSVFYPANATVTQQKLKVWCSKVKEPIAVRYAFVNYLSGEGLLFNTAGLPVLPFRTDSWSK